MMDELKDAVDQITDSGLSSLWDVQNEIEKIHGPSSLSDVEDAVKEITAHGTRSLSDLYLKLDDIAYYSKGKKE